MAENHNITAANAESVMTVETLFPNGFRLEQYSTDQALSSASVQLAETRLGVDGRLVGGFITAIQVVTISIEASYPSVKYLVDLYDAMVTGRTTYLCSLVSTVPSIGIAYKWYTGILQTAASFRNQKKVLDPTSWVFHFERMERSAL